MNIEILKKYNIKAKKKLGQNFLVNDEIVESISRIIDITWKNVVEVGPGYWALTKKLLEKKRVDAVCLNVLKDSNSFGTDENSIDFITPEGSSALGTTDKLTLALRILEHAEKLWI